MDRRTFLKSTLGGLVGVIISTCKKLSAADWCFSGGMDRRSLGRHLVNRRAVHKFDSGYVWSLSQPQMARAHNKHHDELARLRRRRRQSLWPASSSRRRRTKRRLPMQRRQQWIVPLRRRRKPMRIRRKRSTRSG